MIGQSFGVLKDLSLTTRTARAPRALSARRRTGGSRPAQGRHDVPMRPLRQRVRPRAPLGGSSSRSATSPSASIRRSRSGASRPRWRTCFGSPPSSDSRPNSRTSSTSPSRAIANDVEACATHVRSGKGGPRRLLVLLERAGAEALRAGEIVHHLREFVQAHRAAPRIGMTSAMWCATRPAGSRGRWSKSTSRSVSMPRRRTCSCTSTASRSSRCS